MRGKIIRGVAGFYHVSVSGRGVYECRARGKIRERKIKPLVGDDAEIDILDETDKIGVLGDILPRKNSLIRPAVANVDAALVVFALDKPNTNPYQLDKVLISMESQGVDCILCFNKRDLDSDGSREIWLRDIYERSGYPLFFFSALTNPEEFTEATILLTNKTVVAAGPSGVGKTTIINLLSGSGNLKTGSVSEKSGRGRHTTRHCELIALPGGTYLCDTPGFSALSASASADCGADKFFPEFLPYITECRFSGCRHISEPDCAVREAVSAGLLSQSRYNNYLRICGEIENNKKCDR